MAAAASAAPVIDASQFDLPKVLADGETVDTKTTLVLVADDTKKRFPVSRRGMLRYSGLARTLLESDSGDATPDFVLTNPHCTEAALKCFIVWINKHAASTMEVSKMAVPLPMGPLTRLFTAWDLKYIETLLVPGGDMHNTDMLYTVAGMCTFVDVKVLEAICCSYLAWKIRKTVEDAKAEGAPTATATVRSWFGLTGDFTEDELKAHKAQFDYIEKVDWDEKAREQKAAYALIEKDPLA